MAKNKALEKKQQTLFDDSKLEIKDRIYSGIDIVFGSEKTRTKREHGPSKVKLVDGKLRIDPLWSLVASCDFLWPFVGAATAEPLCREGTEHQPWIY